LISYLAFAADPFDMPQKVKQDILDSSHWQCQWVSQFGFQKRSLKKETGHG